MEKFEFSHYTLEQKLDRMLQLLKVRAFTKSIEPELQNPISISLILNSNFGDTDNDEVEYFTKILLDDGHIPPLREASYVVVYYDRPSNKNQG